MSRGSREPLRLSKKVIFLKASKQEKKKKGEKWSRNSDCVAGRAGVAAPPAAGGAGAGDGAGELAVISSPSHARKQQGLVGVRARLVAVYLPGVEHGGGQRQFT